MIELASKKTSLISRNRKCTESSLVRDERLHYGTPFPTEQPESYFPLLPRLIPDGSLATS